MITKPLWLLFIIQSAGLLGAENFGIFMFTIAVSTIIAGFFELGLDLHIVRAVSPQKHKAKELASLSVSIRLIAIVLMLVVALPIYDFFLADTYSPAIFASAMVYGALFSVITHFRSLFRSLELVKYEAISVIWEKLVIAAAGFYVLFTTADLLTYMLVYNAGLFITAVYAYSVIRKLTGARITLPTGSAIMSMLRPASPFAVLNVIQIIYTRLGTILIERLSGNSIWVGFHNAGARFADAFVIFPNTIVAAVYPVFCRVHDQKDKLWTLADLSSRILLAITVPIGAAMFIAHIPFTSFVFTDEYLPASHAIAWFGLTIIASAQVFVFGSIVSASGLQARQNRLIGPAFALSLVLYLVFIPKYGFIAAAIITFADQLTLLLISVWIAREKLYLKQAFLNALRATISPLALFLVYPFIEPSLVEMTPVLHLLTLVAMLGVGTLLFRVVSIKDVRLLLELRKTYQ